MFLLALPFQAPADASPWVRANLDGRTLPVWGHAEGLRVGLHPLRGPRGLLRVYAPYLDHPAGRVINFIAIEPIPQGQSDRGYSEMEFSGLDNTQGKRFWSSNTVLDHKPRPSTKPAIGWIETINGVQCLCVWILVEPFDNGAHVYLKLTFRADRPHQVGISTFAHDDSVPLKHCIVTATMGNYARLRRLRLADRVILAGDLWPDYASNGFTEHARFPLAELIRTTEGHALAIASPDEADPAGAEYAPGTRDHWHYRGQVALQRWEALNPDPSLEVWVNGRRTYWNSDSPIPGGVAFENFEIVAPFRQGGELWFGVKQIDTNSH